MKYGNVLVASVLMAALVSFPSHAKNPNKGNNKCPVGQVTADTTLDEEFGTGTQDLTKCLEKRNQVKMVVQINQMYSAKPDGTLDTSKPFALGNIANIIDDYEITHGMTRGKDYEIVVVIHSAGGKMALKNSGFDGVGMDHAVTNRNPFQSQVEALIAKGVKFYFCQNTTRAYLANNTLPLPSETTSGLGATGELITGMLYTTAGLTSIADFQHVGYQYIQP